MCMHTHGIVYKDEKKNDKIQFICKIKQNENKKYIY